MIYTHQSRDFIIDDEQTMAARASIGHFSAGHFFAGRHRR
jgi:hypothetical protein